RLLLELEEFGGVQRPGDGLDGGVERRGDPGLPPARWAGPATRGGGGGRGGGGVNRAGDGLDVGVERRFDPGLPPADLARPALDGVGEVLLGPSPGLAGGFDPLSDCHSACPPGWGSPRHPTHRYLECQGLTVSAWGGYNGVTSHR